MKNNRNIFFFFFLMIAAATFELFAAGTPAGTIIQSRSRVTFSTRSGGMTDTVYSATLNLVVSQKASINITPLSNARTTASDSVIVEYAVTVINSGNGEDMAKFSLASSKGWFTQIFHDESGDQLLQSTEASKGAINETPLIPADNGFSIIIQIHVPRGEELNGTVDTTMLLIKSGFDSTAQITGNCFTTVQTAGFNAQNPGLTVNNATPAAGQQIVFSFTLTNNGSVQANNVIVSNLIPSGLTYVSGTSSSGTFNGGSVPVVWTLGAILPGQSVTMSLTASVNTGITPGTVIENQWNVLYSVGSNNYSLLSNSVPVTIAGSMQHGNSITAATSASTITASDTAKYRFVVTNTGSYKDLIEISTISSQNLPWKFYRDANKNGVWDVSDPLLTNTNDSAGVDLDSVAIGDSVSIFALAQTPRVETDMTKDSLLVTATSAGNRSKFSKATTVTSIAVPVVSMSMSMFPAGNQPAGSVITYTISYSNNGSAGVSNFTINDVTPKDTRYIPNSVKVNNIALLDNNGIVSVNNDQNDNTVISVAVGTLAAKASGSVEFKVKVK